VLGVEQQQQPRAFNCARGDNDFLRLDLELGTRLARSTCSTAASGTARRFANGPVVNKLPVPKMNLETLRSVFGIVIASV